MARSSIRQPPYIGTSPIAGIRTFIDVVAVVDGEAIANCAMERLRHRMRRHRAEVCGFVISGPFQGTGLARRMLNHLVDHARSEWGCSILEIACRGDTHPERAYVALGFTEWARMPGGYDDPGVSYAEVRLYKRI